MDFLHIRNCAICQAYAEHVTNSGQPPAWTVVLGQCERLRAERNDAVSTASTLRHEKSAAMEELKLTKGRLQYYQNESVRLRLELESSKVTAKFSSSQETRVVATNTPVISPSIASPGRRDHRGPRTIAELEALMKAAHEPGNMRALNKIKALCAEAHNTLREHKTPVQQYLLVHWRNPDAPDKQPPSPTQSPLKTNPRLNDPIEVWYDYLCTHQTSWPRGVRRDANNRPFLPDLRASRTVAQLRPNDVANEAAAMVRFEFMQIVTDIFERPGFYQNITKNYKINVSPVVNLQPYSLPPPITIESVARHLAECGVTVHNAYEELEPWSRSYKLSKEMDAT